MVSNASDDLPDPDTPVITVNFSWGMESEMFLRLWTRAPWILIKSSTGILIIRVRQCEPGELSVQRSDAENAETSAEKSNIGRGSLALGSPQEVTEKLLFVADILGADRILLHLSVGTMPHGQVMRAIELLGSEVAPALRSAGPRPRDTASALPRG